MVLYKKYLPTVIVHAFDDQAQLLAAFQNSNAQPTKPWFQPERSRGLMTKSRAHSSLEPRMTDLSQQFCSFGHAQIKTKSYSICRDIKSNQSYLTSVIALNHNWALHTKSKFFNRNTVNNEKHWHPKMLAEFWELSTKQ